jgi:hypothetical protein
MVRRRDPSPGLLAWPGGVVRYPRADLPGLRASVIGHRPPAPSRSFSITWPMRKLAGLGRDGNPWKRRSHRATKAWAGTSTKTRSIRQRGVSDGLVVGPLEERLHDSQTLHALWYRQEPFGGNVRTEAVAS